MWVFCCGPVRSGSTLQFNITRSILEESKKGFTVEYDYSDNFPAIFNKYNDIEGFKVFKTHSITPFMENLIYEDKAYVIGCYRDIRDVLVSITKKQNKSFENVFTEDFVLKYIKYNKYIKKLPNSMISRYESFYCNIFNEASRISVFLGIEIDDKIKNDINEKHSFINVSKNININKMEKFISKNGKEFILDKKTLVHHDHFGNIHPNSFYKDLNKNQLNKIEKVSGLWLFQKGYKVSFLNLLYNLLILIKKKN
ncbi:MAG: sulfotransferase domain-containing protein [bacterium]|nr:sulfotransferase domain-containing protein [bacterium]